MVVEVNTRTRCIHFMRIYQTFDVATGKGREEKIWKPAMIISNNDEMMYKRNGAQKFCVPIILKWYVWCECVCRSSFLFGSIFGNRCQYRDKHQAYNRLRMQGYIAFYCKIKCFGVNDCKRRQQRRCDDDDDKIVVFRTIYSIFDGFLLRSVCHTEEHPWHPYLACSFISRCFLHLMITIFSTDFVFIFPFLFFVDLNHHLLHHFRS